MAASSAAVPSISDDGRTFSFPDTPEGTALAQQVRRWIDSAATSSRLATLLAEAKEIPSRHALVALGAREEAIRHLEQTYGLLSSAQVARQAGSTSSNLSEFGSRQSRQWDAIAIRVGRSLKFPAFQFDPVTGRLAADLVEVFQRFRTAGWDQDSVALWFVSPSGKLGGREPAALLSGHGADRAAAIDAALDAAAIW